MDNVISQKIKGLIESSNPDEVLDGASMYNDLLTSLNALSELVNSRVTAVVVDAVAEGKKGFERYNIDEKERQVYDIFDQYLFRHHLSTKSIEPTDNAASQAELQRLIAEGTDEELKLAGVIRTKIGYHRFSPKVEEVKQAEATPEEAFKAHQEPKEEVKTETKDGTK